MLEVSPIAHRQEGQQHGEGQGQHGHERTAQVNEKHDTDQADDEAFFDQLLAQGSHGVFDQGGAVVGDDQLHSLGERRPDRLADRLLDPLEHVVDALAEANHNDAAGGVPHAVVVDHAAADVGAKLHVAHVADSDRRPVLLGPQADLLDVVDPLDVAPSPHHVLTPGELDDPAANLLVAHPNALDDAVDRDVIGEQLVRIDRHLVLLDVSADGGHLGHAGNSPDLILDVPVLERAQLGQGVPAGPVDEDVLKAPADTGRVGPELRRDACRQLAGHPAHVFQDPAPSPVEVGAVIENHVDQREAEERVGPHRLDARRREQLGDDRVGDLVLDDVGAAVFPRRVDDHLNVGQVGNGVERRVEDGPTPAGQDRGHEHDDQERIAGAELDDAGDHGSWPLSKDGSLSASV